MRHIFITHSSVDGYLGSFHSVAIVNNASVNVGVHVFFCIMIFSDVCRGVGLLDYVVVLFLVFWGTSILFHEVYFLTLQIDLLHIDDCKHYFQRNVMLSFFFSQKLVAISWQKWKHVQYEKNLVLLFNNILFEFMSCHFLFVQVIKYCLIIYSSLF